MWFWLCVVMAVGEVLIGLGSIARMKSEGLGQIAFGVVWALVAWYLRLHGG